MERTAMEWVLRALLAPEPRLAPDSPARVTVLLQHYVATGADEARVAVESGLAYGLGRLDQGADACERLEWLRTLADGAACADDERLQARVRQALPGAIDALEADVRRDYEPGEGLAGTGCSGHIRCASALVAAYDLTGRLPYAMLAEELVQFGRRRWWDGDAGVYDADTVVNCTAAHVLCRLAGLHADPDYLARAVVAPERHYRRDAHRILEAIAAPCRVDARCAAAYGLALLGWFALESILQ